MLPTRLPSVAITDKTPYVQQWEVMTDMVWHIYKCCIPDWLVIVIDKIFMKKYEINSTFFLRPVCQDRLDLEQVSTGAKQY